MHGGAPVSRNEQRALLVSPSTIFYTGLTVVLVLIPLLGSIMLPTGAAIAAGIAAGGLLSAIGRLSGDGRGTR